jgi:two-component system sensor histidine kinase MtrB
VRRRSLRLRLSLAFGIGATLLSVLFASLAYFGVRHILVTERQSTDLRQAYVNAALVRNALTTNPASVSEILQSLDIGTSSTSYTRWRGQWFATPSTAAQRNIPVKLQRMAARNIVARQVVLRHGTPVLFIDVPLPHIHATYYQLHSLSDLEATLRRLFLIFAGGALFTSLLGAASGSLITRRAMAPLLIASEAAQRVAAGELDTRIPEDPKNSEVATLATSFNTMIEQLVLRLQRDARFAGDVSHELRSPLTTLSNAVEVMRHSRGELSVEARSAFDLLASDVGTFLVLVEDLLEIARSDAGLSAMNLEPVALDELVRQCVKSAVRRHDLRDVPVEIGQGVSGVLVNVDRRRFERVMTNLLDNAQRYGGGATAIRLSARADQLIVDVDDAGAGVDPRDRERIFDRFYRGTLSNDRGAARGSGLGLALVADHVAHFAGTVAVLSSPEGGARLEIQLPRVIEELS